MTALRVDHIGIACRSAEATARFYTEGLGLAVVSRETLDEMKLKVIKVGCGETIMELLEPLEDEKVIRRFLETRGEGFHHICYAVEDVQAAAADLRSKGYTPLWDEPRRGAGGCRVQFLRPGNTFGMLVELSQAGSGRK